MTRQHLLALAMVLCVVAPAWATAPVLPQAYIDTTMPSTAGYITKTVCASGCDFTSLNTAVNNSSIKSAGAAGVIVTLTAGQTFTGTVTLPVHNNTGWVIIRSSALASLPAAGVRVAIADKANMPLLNVASGNVIAASAAAAKYRFVGLEIAPTSGAAVGTLVSFGASDTSLSTLPSFITFDRCYIHGDPGMVNNRRGIAMSAISFAVIDSYLSDFKEDGMDNQALWAYNSPGPFKIVNNYLSAAGEVVMFGGADPLIANLVPSDIEIRRNHFFKPLRWKPDDPSWDGSTWTVKNLLELKNAQRVLADGNTLENNWQGAQTGFAILLTPRNQDNTAPWSVVQDVTLTNNVIRNSYQGFNILGRDNIWTSQPMARVLIQNNIVYSINDISSSWGGGGIFLIQNGVDSLTINHNTGVGYDPYNTILSDLIENLNTTFVFTNNIFAPGGGGIAGSNVGHGTVALDAYFPGYVYNKNLFVGDLKGYSYPAGTYNESAAGSVGFVNFTGGDYRLTTGSAYHNAATDGTDIGVNFNALNAALGLFTVMLEGKVTFGGRVTIQ